MIDLEYKVYIAIEDDSDEAYDAASALIIKFAAENPQVSETEFVDSWPR